MQRIAIVSKDRPFWTIARSALGIDSQFEVVHFDMSVVELESAFPDGRFDAFVIDMDATKLLELEALHRISKRFSGQVPILAVLEKHSNASIRVLFHLKISDFIVKPVTAPDIIRACLGMLKRNTNNADQQSRVLAFMPAASGNGATTLAIQTAFLLHKSSTGSPKTCVVDLNFNDGSCAEYLDLEPHFELEEVIKQPDRLDQNLLEAMTSKHASGLCILASPSSPTETKLIDADLVLRILDVVSVSFDHVIIDLPRTWLPWTEAILMGVDETYVVAEMTVPSMRRAQKLVQAILEKSDIPIDPKVIINRFERRSANTNISADDAIELLGEHFVGGVANNYKLVRNAIDRGVAVEELNPKANVIEDLKKIVLPEASKPQEEKRESTLLSFGQNLFRQRA